LIIFYKINLILNILIIYFGKKIIISYIKLGIGDWGLGIGDWGLGPIPNPQSPIPNPQSPIKYFILLIYNFNIYFNFI